MRALLLLIAVGLVLVGCVSTHHKHPHDHGLSAYKGRIKQINADIDNLLNSIRTLEIEIVEARNRLVKVEAYKKRFALIESDILEIERLNESTARTENNINNINRLKMKRLRSDLQRLFKRLHEIEDKVKPQKLIELKSEPEKDN